MSVRAKIATAIRWATWPVLVIVGLNIENAARQAGYATLISEHWKDSIPVVSEAYDLASTSWVIYPALMFLGAGTYAWVARIAERAERPGGAFQRCLIRINCDSLATAFFKKGFVRKRAKPEEIEKINRKLVACSLTPVPVTFSKNEELNRVYGSYCALLSKGQFEHAEEFLAGKADFIHAQAQQ